MDRRWWAWEALGLQWHLATRGVVIWVCVRLLTASCLVVAGAGIAGAVALDPTAAVLCVAVSAVLGVMDVARRREWAMVHNLGLSFHDLMLWLGAPAALGEIVGTLLRWP